MSATPKEPSSPVILNVDNDESVRYTRSRVLSDAGYRIIDATTGEEALVRAAVDRPDLIILNVILPGIDGLEVCRRLKADQETSYIMVLQVASAPTSKTDLAAGVEGGADGYLIEPIDPVELLATVRALLRLAEREKDNHRLIQKLIRSERQLTDATSAAEYGRWDWHIPTGELEWCGVHERLFGMFPGAFSGKVEAFTDILHPDDRARVWKKIDDLINTREERFFDESRFVHPDGSVHWMAGTGRIFYDEAGHAVRMTGVIQDITDRKQAEDKLKQYRTIMAGTADGIALFELNAGYIEQNMAHRVLLGYSDEDLHGLTPALHLGDETFRKVSEELIETGRYAGEVRSRRKDGQWLDFSLSAFGIYDDKGDVLCYVGIMRDISERKQQEAVLRESEARFSAIFEQSTAGIAQTDLTGRFMLANDRYCEMTGRSREMLLTLRMQDITHPDDLPANLDNFRSLAEDRGGSFVIEKRYLKPDGSLVWVHNEVSAIRDVTGRKRYITAVAADITENKKYEQQLAAAKQQLQATLSATEIGVWHWDLTDDRLHTDGNLKGLFGLEGSEDLPPEDYTQRIHSDDFVRNQAAIDRVLQNGGFYDQQFRVIRPDGTLRWLHSRGKVETGEEGRRSFVGVVLDITQRKHAEEALRESEERFRTLADNMSQFAWMADQNGWIFWYNRRWFDYTGTTLEDMQGWGWEKVHHPDHLHRVIKKWQHALETGHEWEDTFPLRGQDGHYRWFLSRAVPIRDTNGPVLRWFGTNTDVTDLREAEQAQAHLAAIVTSSDDAIISKDLDGVITSWNQAAERLFGYTAEEVVGRSVTILMPPEHLGEEPDILKRIRQGGFVQYETIRRRKDGTLLDISLTVSPIKDEEGRIIGASKVARDITERRRQEEELRRLKEELEVRVQERTAELLATQGRLMTVTSQLSLTEQRERRKLARDLHDYLAQMLVVGQMKTGMLKKQLPHNPTSATLLQDLDKVFQQALVYTRTLIAELSPPSLQDSGLPAALKWLGERFEKDGLRIDVRADCNAVPLVEEQAVVVFQAVRELLFNVMKHSGVGGATVTVTMNEDSFLRVAVADQGIGFSSDAWQRSAQPGHLGLVSVRERFRAMGGRVDVESRLGQGTTVTLVLPVTTKASGHPRVAGG